MGSIPHCLQVVAFLWRLFTSLEATLAYWMEQHWELNTSSHYGNKHWIPWRSPLTLAASQGATPQKCCAFAGGYRPCPCTAKLHYSQCLANIHGCGGGNVIYPYLNLLGLQYLAKSYAGQVVWWDYQCFLLLNLDRNIMRTNFLGYFDMSASSPI